MTKDAIDQIFDRARHGDVFAQTLMGQILCEGKYVQQDRQNGIGWLRKRSNDTIGKYYFLIYFRE